MSVLEGPFAEYLERNRARCNTRFAMLGGHVRPELGYGVIRDIIAPLVQDVPQKHLTVLAHCLIDSAFVLLRKGLIGPESRSLLINQLWTEGFPQLMPFLLEESSEWWVRWQCDLSLRARFRKRGASMARTVLSACSKMC